MLSRKEIAQKIEEIRSIIRADITPFSNDTAKQQARRKALSKDNVEYFYRTYLPNFFTSPSARFHFMIDKELEKRAGDIIIFCGPREHAKTVRWSIGYTLHQILFRKRRFIINISETEDLAIFMNLNVRTHLESNPRILYDFGELRNYNFWAENEFVTKNSVKVLARGYKQPVRGLLFGPYRPDYIRIDDLSSQKSCRNQFLEKEKMEWVLGECYGGLSSTGTLLWTGNILRKTSAIAQIEKEAQKPERNIWYRKFSAELPGGKVLWPERYSHEYFKKLRQKVGNKIFEREWQQNPIEEGIFFREEWFNRFSTEEVQSLWKSMDKKIIYIDPSYGMRRQSAKYRGSDKKVAVVMGKGRLGYFLFDAISRQTTLEKFGNGVCDLYRKWHPPVIWYEGNFGQADLIGMFLDEAGRRKNVILPRKPYYNFSPKADRIERGNPLAENGQLWYCEQIADVQDVIDNLCMYPDVDFDDPADAFGSALEILERGPIKIHATVW